jgi:hypothetical protein
MSVITKSGRDLTRPCPPEPPPDIPAETPLIVRQMIRLLLDQQASIATEDFQTLVLYLEKGEKLCMKLTRRLAI